MKIFSETIENQEEAAIEEEKIEKPYRDKPEIIKAEPSRVSPYGKKSKYYGLEVNGYVWDPYIDARWLPANYLSFIKTYEGNTHKAICEKVSFAKSITFTLETIKKMEMIRTRDPEAFRIEWHFFSVNVCKDIMADYVKKIIEYMDSAIKKKEKESKKSDIPVIVQLSGNSYCIAKTKEVLKNHKGVMEHEKLPAYYRIVENLKRFEGKVSRCSTFRELLNVCNAHEFMLYYKRSVIRDLKKSKDFMEAYRKRGAWKTAAYLVRFEGLSFNGKFGKEAYEELLRMLNFSKAYEIHRILLDMLEVNQYEF